MGYIEQFARKGAKIPESARGCRFAGPVTQQELNLCQLVLGDRDCHGDGVELAAEPHHSLAPELVERLYAPPPEGPTWLIET